ncbi:MAG: hypothetical protein IT576_09435 [Verrucomicrobiales bacterium]|nr:hypothetical protein [Verrucomicrobiales bacterium]
MADEEETVVATYAYDALTRRIAYKNTYDCKS